MINFKQLGLGDNLKHLGSFACEIEFFLEILKNLSQ